MNDQRNYLSTREAAHYLGLSARTLNRYRVSGDGPVFHRFGGRVRYPLGRVADLVPVARERLPARIGAEREPERQAPEEGLLAQELGHAVAGALRGLRLHAGGHHAASRAGSTGVTK